MWRRSYVTLFAISVVFTAGCAAMEKKRAGLEGSSAEAIASCTEDQDFSKSPKGSLLFSFVDHTIAQGAYHWEILNVDTGRKFVFLTEGGIPHLNGKPRTYRYCFSVPPGTYRLTKIVLNEIKGIVSGEKEYRLKYQFSVGPSRVVYLGHIEVTDPDHPKLGDSSIKNWFRSAGAMFTGSHLPRTLHIEVTDRHDSDVGWFREHYKTLPMSNITTHILEPADM